MNVEQSSGAQNVVNDAAEQDEVVAVLDEVVSALYGGDGKFSHVAVDPMLADGIELTYEPSGRSYVLYLEQG